ncbi:MAG: GNAT family N-acetyltransferase [Gammaproteobacteria bacterium]|nr:GNAT family N-acetyltransferase [Gammaproteobacteria bacterium]
MRVDELATLDAWVLREGWNPGLHDLAIAHSVDPEAFIALREGDALAGAGTIFRHSPEFGFMGLFIMRPDLRGRGLGRVLWEWRRDALLARLADGATLGMDGVFDMVSFYARGGFHFAHRNLRHEGIARIDPPDSAEAPGIITLAEVATADILAFDRAHFPCARAAFLLPWLAQAGGVGRALRDTHGTLIALGFARRCREGFKFGPVFARDSSAAGKVLRSLLWATAGQRVQIDIPEPNVEGLALARAHGLTEVFGCARLYLGPGPDLPNARIFGVTSFEFG